jgi:hypothetical protein
VSFGLLLPHMQVGRYWFSVRKQGSFMSNITAGRLEILRILKKRNTKDIMEKVCYTQRTNVYKSNIKLVVETKKAS